MTFSKTILTVGAALIAFGFAAESADAAQGHIRARGANGVAAAGSYNGNSYARARGHVTNSDGSTTAVSGGAFKLNNGAYGARGSTTTYGADGSVTHSGQAGATGAKGTATTSGGFTRDGNGNTSGSRSTQVTSTATGNTYNGSTSYTTADGVSHTSVCHDASGAEITCPSR